MPVLSITTNAPINDLDNQAALKKVSESLSRLLGKPESYVMVQMTHQANMLFAGSAGPTAYLELKSINLPEDQTPVFSAEICQMMEDMLSIPKDRIYIEFSNMQRHLFGWNSHTF